MGKSNLRQLESENIVALCDVDHNYAAETFKRYPKAKVYTDFRKMFDKQKDIDAVIIATPVPHHPAAEIPPAAPHPRMVCRMIRPLGRRAKPEVPIQR